MMLKAGISEFEKKVTRPKLKHSRYLMMLKAGTSEFEKGDQAKTQTFKVSYDAKGRYL